MGDEELPNRKLTPEDICIGFDTNPSIALIKKLEKMINDAYVIGEAGIAANTAEWPFFRVKEEDVD